MTTIGASTLPEHLARLRAAWPGGPWEWDGRFGCALSALGKDQEAAAREALAAAFPAVWTAANLAEAPRAVHDLCGHVGGLRGDQLVYTAELADGVLAYCLWWPWGGGKNFSARVGAVGGGDQSKVVRAALGIK